MTSGIAPQLPKVPALASEARATAAPASSRARAGGSRSRMTSAGPGSRVATVREAARRRTPSSSSCSRWSALVAPSRTARAVAPMRWSWSACSRIPRPNADAARRIRSASSTVKKPASQKTSQNSARPSSATAGKHLVHDLVDIRRAIGGLGMGAQEGPHHPDRHAASHAADDPQVTQLLRLGEPVAGLGLDRGGAGQQLGPQPAFDQRLQLRVGGRPGGFDGAQDAAARIRLSRQACRCLVRSVAGVDRVGVRIHQARRDQRDPTSSTSSAGGASLRATDPRHAAIARWRSPTAAGPSYGSGVSSLPEPVISRVTGAIGRSRYLARGNPGRPAGVGIATGGGPSTDR